MMTDMMTIRDVAQQMKVSPRTVQRWIRRGLLPAVRVGKVVRIRQEDLLGFLEHHRDEKR